MTIQSINPATGEVIETFEPFSQQRIDEALDRAQQAFRQWRSASYDERATLVREIAKTLRAQKERLARTITLEMGKPIAEAEAEVEKCAWNCDFYAEEAKRFLANEPAPSTAQESYVAFRPLGVVLAVMPWNYPLWQVFRFAAPALMAGNVGVLKHASNVTRCALEIERVVSEAAQAVGAPKDLFQALIVPGSEVDKLIKDRRIAAVTLTGSDPAGVSVATAAGSVLKKTVLELGGSDAFIILDDADIEAAAQMAAKARFQNTGQSCIAAKRFIVVESVADAFERAFVKATEALKVGDPLDKDTQVGAMARLDLREDLDRQVRESLAQGAKTLTGGEALSGPGAYYAPTILANVTPEMTVFKEETFGPVAAVIRAKDEADAIRLANSSDFGLGGALWTRDTERGERVAAQIESGAVFINGMTASDPRLPFGGVKRSGYGRELSSYGIREFVNIQTVWIGPVKGAAPVSAAAE
ncbi:MAG TPA: NAD-dependent succinate-semialdehyde dehydrogenase [Ktedonobacterales bacterium]|nr:NAD-dependent succinate-semialdehyde dehydrogenase [Ktedonobacterales bacterium]